MKVRLMMVLLFAVAAMLHTVTACAQVLIRVGEPGRAVYSELHEGLREGTPAADSVLAIMRSKAPGPVWHRVRDALSGKGEWNDGLMALTRLAELRSGPMPIVPRDCGPGSPRGV